MKDGKRKKKWRKRKTKMGIKEIKVQTSPQTNERYMERLDYFTTSQSLEGEAPVSLYMWRHCV
jgi:hypothetical protein